MKQSVIFLIMFPLIILSQSRVDNGAPWKKEHISVGVFSEETGYSLISYTRNIFRDQHWNREDYKKRREYFIAFGTSIMQSTISLGIKKSLLVSNLNKVLYSSVGIKGVYGVGKWEDFIAPSISIGLDIPVDNHEHYRSNRKHPLMWLLRPSRRIRSALAHIRPGISQKEFINIGISATVRLNENQIKFITIPHLNLSYRW